MRLADSINNKLNLAYSWYETTFPKAIRHEFEHYLALLRSGVLIALILWAFELFSNPYILKAIENASGSLVKHASHPPVELVVVGWFILSVSIMATGTWGKILREYAVKPLNELFIHAIGIASGIFVVVWVRDTASFSADTWLITFVKFALLEFLMATIAGISILAKKTCEIELGTFLQGIVKKPEDAEKLTKLFDFLSVPVGGWFMWACYTDLARIGATAMGIQH